MRNSYEAFRDLSAVRAFDLRMDTKCPNALVILGLGSLAAC